MVQVLAVGVSFVLNDENNFNNQLASISDSIEVIDNTPKYIPPQKLSNPPEIIKAVYVTGYSAGSKKYLNYLNNLFEKTDINAVVIDIKDYSGLISFDYAIGDIDTLVRFFHDKNIYVIGRIVVFQDPIFAKLRPDLAVYDKEKTIDKLQPISWQDNKKLLWVDPASKEVWDYNISLAKGLFYHGFDEVNFDYIRFPSDGKMENMGFPIWDGKISKADVIKSFFEYLRQQLLGNKISADLFGLTTVDKNDMGIGQIIEDAFENFDYICPMVYPSHYANGFIGFRNPADYPYEVVKYSINSAITRLPLAKFRPWLQDFNMKAKYTPEMVRSQIKATKDALGESYNGFMLWNPSNIYNYEY